MPNRDHLNEPQRAFAEKLFELYPDFLPTRSLYLDFEGSGSGWELIISLFWPKHREPRRFAWRICRDSKRVTREDVQSALEELEISGSGPSVVVAYSQGGYEPNERERLIDLLGIDPWPKASWVNLLHPFQQCPQMTATIERHRHVVHKKDKSQVRRSLEALEWEFDIIRDQAIRGHNNRYSDGLDGKMQVLSLAQKYARGGLSDAELKDLKAYCLQDVKSMYRIARTCELGLYGRGQRRERYRR